MTLLLNTAAVVLLVLAVCIVAINCLYSFYRIRNRRQGIEAGPSMVFLVAQVFAVLGDFASSSAIPRLIPRGAFIAVAVVDPSLWTLAAASLSYLRRRK